MNFDQFLLSHLKARLIVTEFQNESFYTSKIEQDRITLQSVNKYVILI